MGMYAEQPVTIKTDSMRRIDLEEVMIHATKTGALLKDLPNRVEVVTKRQIEASGINKVFLLREPKKVQALPRPWACPCVSRELPLHPRQSAF